MSVIRTRRRSRSTLLLVGEGYAECAVLSCLKNIYTRDHQGVHVTIRNARGGGGSAVIDHAIRLIEQAAYNQAAALLDTDTQWSDASVKRARAKHLLLIGSHPCIEAWLLDVVGEQSTGTTNELKRRFQERFSGNAHDDGLVRKHFTHTVWESARHRRIDQVARLIAMMLGEG